MSVSSHTQTGLRQRLRGLSGILVVMVCVGLLLPALIGGTILVHLGERRMNADLENYLDDHLALLSESLVQSVWNLDTVAVTVMVDAFLRDDSFVQVVVTEGRANVIVSRELAERRKGKSHVRERDIRLGDNVIGRVRVEADDGLRVAARREQMRQLMLVLAGQVALALALILFVVHRRVLKPLNRLKEFSDQIAGGNLEGSLTWSQADEIGQLASQLESMRSSLQQAFAEEELVLDNVQVGVIFVRDRQISLANATAHRLFGYSDGAMTGFSSEILYLSHEQFVEVGVRAYLGIANGKSYQEELQLQRQDGSHFWGLMRGCAVDQARPLDGSIWIFEDISDRRAAEERQKLAATVFESTSEGVIITDGTSRIRAVNRAFCAITGYSEDEVIGRTPALLQSGRQDAEFYAEMWKQLRESGHWSGEIWNRRRNGEVYPEWLTINAVRDAAGELSHYVGVFSDISTIKRSEEELARLAHFDQLTGLPNRVLALDRLGRALRRAERQKDRVGVLFIDLDNFKNVNDTLGHHFGDELLCSMSGKLSALLRSSDTLARLGGDEFLLIVEGDDPDLGLAQLADRVLTALKQPVWISGHEIFVSGSIGISLFPEDGEDSATLIRNADAAMYVAKQAGRNAYRFYSAELTERAQQRMELETELRRAIQREELRVLFQPQVHIETRQLSGAEALVRWQHPRLGLVTPDRFIPIAEETGLINEIGEWVLRASCQHWRFLAENGLVLPKVSVNVSARQFENGRIVDVVRQVLLTEDFDPIRLQLEITESMAMDPSASDHLHALRALGIELAIDDFGTGYSSLAHIQKMPVQMLKIDRSFIAEITEGNERAAIVSAIVQMAHTLNLKVIAEGVETSSQATYLVNRACGLAQGYLYGRPMPPEAFLDAWPSSAPAGRASPSNPESLAHTK